MDAIESGNPKLMYEVAQSYDMNGNDIKAFEFYQKTIKFCENIINGNSSSIEEEAQSMYMIGDMLTGGKGVPKNDLQAFEGHQRAANIGNVDAIRAIFDAYNQCIWCRKKFIKSTRMGR